MNAPGKYAIHIGAALKNGELTAAEATEIPILPMHYVGQPYSSILVEPTKSAIEEFAVPAWSPALARQL